MVDFGESDTVITGHSGDFDVVVANSDVYRLDYSTE